MGVEDAMDDLARYTMLLKAKDANEGHNPGALGLDGWRKCSKAELRRLYAAGKLTVLQAVRFGLGNADHGKRLGACKDVEEISRIIKEMIAAGVEINRVHLKR